jgi:hypothetical protein
VDARATTAQATATTSMSMRIRANMCSERSERVFVLSRQGDIAGVL